MPGRDRSIVAKLRMEIGDYRAKAAEVKRLNDQVAQSGTQAGTKAAAGFDKMAAAVTKNRASLDTLAGGATKLGLVIGAGVAVAVKSFADFDKQMSAVAATGSDARTNLAALRDTAVKAGADTAFSAGEAAEGIENLLKAGVSAKDVIGGGLTGALNLAAAGSLGVGDAAEIAATAMTQFKLQGKDVPHIADLLAAGAGKAQGEVSDLAGALKQGGLVAAAYGLSIEETTGTLSAFAAAGLIGSDAGTSFKTMLQALGNPTAKAAAQMKALGISAYDANGEFVGTVGLAGQLQEAFKNQSDETRNAALATIFGSDAVRAANVLYEQGAAGIQGWVDAVNDAGYAAQVAATKMDNLSGDIEFLGGSLDSVFLKSGSGANEFLRGLVQGADDLVNSIGKIPAPILQAGLGIAALASGSLLAFGGISKLAIGLADSRAAMVSLSKDAPRTAGAIRGLQTAGIVAAAAIAAIAAGVALQNRLVGDSIPPVTAATAALLALGNGAAGAQQKLDQFFTATSGSVVSLNGVADAARTLASANDIQNWSADVARSLGLQTNVLVQAQDRFGQLDQAMSSLANNGAAEQAGKSFLELSKQAAQAGIGYDKLIALFPQYKASLVDQANQLGVTTLDARDYALWMQGKIPAAVQAAAAAQPEAAKQIGLVGDAAEETTKSLQELVDGYFESGQAALAASSSTIAYEQAIDDAAKSVKENGKTLDKHTDKGRANRQALDQIASATQRLVSDQAANNASTKTLEKTTQQGRDAFIAAARQMGLNSSEAKKLADRYGLIPKNVKTAVTAPGAEHTAAQAKDLNSKLRGLPKSVQAQIRSTFDKSGYNEALNKLNAIKNKQVYTYITTIRQEKGTASKTTRTATLATGGPVWGAGTATSDSIDAKLSNGEFVLRAAAAARLGLGRLMHMNETGEIPGFAHGGLVGFASGGSVNIDAIMRLISAITTPLSSIASLQSKAASDLAAANAAARRGAAPRAARDRAVRAYNTAVDRRDDARIRNARQLADAKDDVAAARAADRRRNSKTSQLALDRAIARQAKISRDNTAETAELNAKVTKTSKAKAAAEANYKKYADASKAATDKYNDSQKALIDLQSQVASSARSISDSYSDAYRGGGDLVSLLEGMKGGAAELKAFYDLLDRLRKQGLSESVIKALEDKGVLAGTELASEILAAGKSAVSALNTTNKNLTDAADKLGFGDATAPGRGYAGGGPVWGAGTGTSDSIIARVSHGEYVMNAVATARHRPELDAMNYGRLPAYAAGGYVQAATVDSGQIARAVAYGLASSKIVITMNGREFDARISSVVGGMADSATNRR